MSCNGKKKGECIKSDECEWELRTLVGKSKRKGFCINKKSSSRLSPKKEINTFKSKKKWQKALSKIRKSNKAKKNWNKAISNVRRRKSITIYYNQLNNFPVFQNMSSNTNEGNNANSFGESPFIYPLVKDWNAKTEDFVLLNTILDTSTSKSTLKTLYESITNVTKRKLITLINICLRLGFELESELWIYLTQLYFNKTNSIKSKDSKTHLDIMKLELYNDDLADYIYENFSDEYKLVKYLENSDDSPTEVTHSIIDSIYSIKKIKERSSWHPLPMLLARAQTGYKFEAQQLIKRYGGVATPPYGNVIIPSFITSIGVDAFNDCNMMTGITIPNSVTSIGKRAFKYCKSLKNIIIPNSVKTIGEYAFSRCKSLKNITIPNSITEIEIGTFDECVSLERFNIPESITTIGVTAFHACISLERITIPNSVKKIDAEAFFSCSSLKRITIPDSVDTIGESAFRRCSSFVSITLPQSITSIENYTFAECHSLTSITIPDSVTTIGIGAFVWCSSLKSVTIPDSVTKIGKGAFQGCKNLSSINIPVSVTTIGFDAFKGCTSLDSRISYITHY